MDPEPPRIILGASAVAGGVFYGMVHLSAAFAARQPVPTRDLIYAVANLVMAALAGGLVAYFVGPALVSLVPIAGLREPHALGFAIGFLSWEGAPWALKEIRKWADRKVREKAQ